MFETSEIRVAAKRRQAGLLNEIYAYCALVYAVDDFITSYFVCSVERLNEASKERIL